MGDIEAPERIAVYGGSFDPVTRGHMLLVREILELGAADVVWIVPCGDREDKRLAATVRDRIHMVELAVAAEFGRSERVRIDGRDSARGAFTPTYALADCYRREYTVSSSVMMVVGEDLVATLPRWRHGKELLASACFLVCPRPGFAFPPSQQGEDAFRDASLLRLADFARARGREVRQSPASSTAARRELRTERRAAALGALLHPAVVRYVEERGLYLRRGAL